MLPLYDRVCQAASRLTTRAYSTSFSLGVRLLAEKFHAPIYGIYGFVRFADEIVDTFHGHDQANLLARFEEDTWRALQDGISLNPILHSFGSTVRQYSISHDLIKTFLSSMAMDLSRTDYNREEFNQYVLGSAEVVGLMCLRVFVDGDEEEYHRLKPAAMRLGAAFQKVNFLRDLKADYLDLGRSYFPQFNWHCFDEQMKAEISAEISADFAAGLEGIRQLSPQCRFGVYTAYVYYRALFKKIHQTAPGRIMEARIRIPNARKYSLMVGGWVRHRLNAI